MLRSNRAAVTKSISDWKNENLEKSGIIIANNVKLRSPVDKGRLRSSYGYEVEETPDGGVVQVGTNVTYSVHQEFGTRYQSGTPHLRPGTNDSRGALIALWSKSPEVS